MPNAMITLYPNLLCFGNPVGGGHPAWTRSPIQSLSAVSVWVFSPRRQVRCVSGGARGADRDTVSRVVSRK
jgi:hypothetical protein